jgi:hypothetical protein
MKKLLLIPFLLMSLVSSPSWAINVEYLYKICKPYQNNGFNVEKTDDIICHTYLVGIDLIP